MLHKSHMRSLDMINEAIDACGRIDWQPIQNKLKSAIKKTRLRMDSYFREKPALGGSQSWKSINARRQKRTQTRIKLGDKVASNRKNQWKRNFKTLQNTANQANWQKPVFMNSDLISNVYHKRERESVSKFCQLIIKININTAAEIVHSWIKSLRVDKEITNKAHKKIIIILEFIDQVTNVFWTKGRSVIQNIVICILNYKQWIDNS